MISTSFYIKTIMSLGAILGILYTILLISKRYTGHQYRGEMKVVDRILVDQQSSLVIVDVRGKELLLSISGKQVTLLDRLS